MNKNSNPKYSVVVPVFNEEATLPELNRRLTSVLEKFGSYEVAVIPINESTVKYTRKFSINEGVYSKEDYKLYRKFRKFVTKYDNLRMALIQK